MLEKVAGENDVEGAVIERPARRAILLDEIYLRVQVGTCARVEIHRMLRCGIDVVHKLPITAAQIENGCRRRNELLEVISRQDLPDAITVIDLRVEPPLVLPLEFPRCF